MASQLPSRMRAAQFKSTSGGLDKNVKLNSNVALPKAARALPKDGVLIKVAYSSLNPADHKILESLAGSFYRKPAIPGCDFAGTAIGSKLPGIKAGDRVFGFTKFGSFGALAEYIVVVGRDLVVKLPESISLVDGSTLGVAGLTAYQSLKPYVKSGDRVLLNGASGGVGTLQIQMAKAMGCKVTAICSGANAKMVQDLGADEVIDYKTTNVIEHLKKAGVQYDYIEDNIFEDFDLYWQSHHYLKPGAKYVTIAGRPQLSFLRTVMAAKLLPSFLGGAKRTLEICVAVAKHDDFAAEADLVANGKVKTIVEQVVDLEDIGKGYARVKSGRTKGKVVIKVAGD